MRAIATRVSSPVRGFAWVKGIALTVVIALLAISMLGTFGIRKSRGGTGPGKASMQMLEFALEEYKYDFKSYPPDNFPSDNGSEMIWYYLCRAQTNAGLVYSPYVKVKPERLTPSDRLSAMKYLSPYGGEYHYIRMDERGTYLLVDSGRDKQLGGVLDREKGFVVIDAAKAADNIYSSSGR